MTKFDDLLARLKTDELVLADATAKTVALLDDLSAKLAAAIAALAAAGVTPEQMQALTDLSTALEADTGNLAAAVTADTPAL